MAHGVSFNLDILDEEEEEEHKQMSKHLLFSEDISPCDESAMHDSFKHLIEEQRRLSEECSEVIEMEQMQDMGKEDLCPVFADDSEDSFNMECMPHDAYSSMTLRILSSMPSRTIGRSKGAIISQCYNKTMKLQCRKRRRPAIFERRHSSRPSIRQYDLDNESQEEDKKMKLLKAELQKLSWSQQGYLLQQQPLSLSEKQELRNKDSAHENFIRKTDCKCEIPCCTRLKYSFLTLSAATSVNRKDLYTNIRMMVIAPVTEACLAQDVYAFPTGECPERRKVILINSFWERENLLWPTDVFSSL